MVSAGDSAVEKGKGGHGEGGNGNGERGGGGGGQSVFCYVNSVFAPGLDEGVGGLWRVSFAFFFFLANFVWVEDRGEVEGGRVVFGRLEEGILPLCLMLMLMLMRRIVLQDGRPTDRCVFHDAGFWLIPNKTQ